MFSAIYIEEEVFGTERVREILSRYPGVPQIKCERYGEIFNRKAQNFRMQKQDPALILAKKYGKHVLPAPAGYGFEASQSYYFSHMLNCVYDCRYCFLQGMYRSANYVLFVNYEDFIEEIQHTLADVEGDSVFYSGYDCDSLALEPVSSFCKTFIPAFAQAPQAMLEIRTKSTQVRHLMEMAPISNCVIAMSFTAQEAAQRWEHKVPSIEKRIDALKKLQTAGWKVALRFEPIIFDNNTLRHYAELFDKVFSELNSSTIHSVSTGLFRMPLNYYKNIVKLYPDEALYAQPTMVKEGLISIASDDEDTRLAMLEQQLLEFVSPQQYYRCA